MRIHPPTAAGIVSRMTWARSQGALTGKKLTQPVDSIDMAYRIAAKTDRDVASLLLLASLNVSQRIETISAGAERRRCKARLPLTHNRSRRKYPGAHEVHARDVPKAHGNGSPSLPPVGASNRTINRP